jgi:hypothetical protein
MTIEDLLRRRAIDEKFYRIFGAILNAYKITDSYLRDKSTNMLIPEHIYTQYIRKKGKIDNSDNRMDEVIKWLKTVVPYYYATLTLYEKFGRHENLSDEDLKFLNSIIKKFKVPNLS